MNRAGMLSNPRFRTGDYLVTRLAAPTFLDGILQPGQPETFRTGDASLQPATGAALKVLPEASHAEVTAVLYTTAALQLEPRPDVITVADGNGLDGDYAVVAIAPWAGLGGSHRVVGLARQAAG